MEIKLIAFDSLGVRSQSTFIQTKDTLIHIDPAAALAPRRFGLPPHRVEVEKLYELVEEISEYLKEAEIVIITHYHYDHHDPNRLIPVELYRGKEVYVKHPKEKINISQRIRASRFLKMIKQYAKEIKIADNNFIVKGGTTIKFSEPVPHGVNDRLGYVVEVSISDKEHSLVYTSDVEGPVLENQLRFILSEKPEIAIIDGPLTYMLGYRFSQEDLDNAVDNLKKIVSSGVKTMILDHHLVRDPDYKDRIAEVLDYAKIFKVKVLTAAEFMGKPVNVLEVKRKELYRSNKLS
ncbi:MAG: hypothetical protein DRO23_04500 [Thermoprotei archaeon]|nr:MAG: hypothetical protein DRO23_04500 [Thermoprotei archaeon]